MSKQEGNLIFTSTVLILVLAIGSVGLGAGMPPKVLKDIDIQLIGVVLYKGESSALIRDRAAGTEQFYEVGDEFRDYRVTQIKAERVEFERKNVQYLLHLSAPSDLLPPRIHTSVATAAPSAPLPTQKSSKTSSSPKSKSTEQKSSSRFIMPMKGRVTSGFGYRTHPMGGGRKFHNGVDIAAPHGTLVKAAAAGKVVFAGKKWSLGNTVVLQHTSGYRTLYGHLSKILVKNDEKVKQGKEIGREGSTGISTGAHLHFSIMRYGKYMDPARYLPLEKE